MCAVLAACVWCRTFFPPVKERRHLSEAWSQINSDPAAGHVVTSANRSEAMAPHAEDEHPGRDVSRAGVWQGQAGISHRTARNKSGEFRVKF